MSLKNRELFSIYDKKCHDISFGARCSRSESIRNDRLDCSLVCEIMKFLTWQISTEGQTGVTWAFIKFRHNIAFCCNIPSGGFSNVGPYSLKFLKYLPASEVPAYIGIHLCTRRMCALTHTRGTPFGDRVAYFPVAPASRGNVSR